MLPTFPSSIELQTARTRLRAWRDADLAAWCAMNADPEVRRHFPSVLDTDGALAEAGRIRAAMAGRGWGLWALEITGALPFAGFVGLGVPTAALPFLPCVELGWRLPRVAWGHGYATEAAEAAVQFAFAQLGLDELVAFTARGNTPSRRVMERLGMSHDPTEDFEHPSVPPGHATRAHVLYRLRKR